MDAINGKYLESDLKYSPFKRPGISSNTIDQFNRIDKRIHDEFIGTIKKDLDSKLKTNPLDKQETANSNKFKKWYKMAYPDKYKSSKSQLSGSQIASNKNDHALFSPNQSILSNNFTESLEAFNIVSKFKDTKNNAITTSLNTIKALKGSSSHNIFRQNKKNTHEKKQEIRGFANTAKINYMNNLNKEYSQRTQAEFGLRKYYTKNKKKFQEKLLKGPPESFRWASWLVSLDVPEYRTNEQYYSLLSQKAEIMIETQIEKDLHRTLTDDNLFSNETSRKQLFNVLKAFAVNDKNVAYCQGMNCIAGFLLVVSEYNEIDSFYLMLALFSYSSGDTNSLGIRGFYLPEFPLLQLYLYQFDYIFYKKMPKLKKHFENLGIPNEAWVSKWFQTLYTICLPLDVVKRLWDCLFASGLEFLFNFTLAILKHFEEDLIKFNDMIDLSEYLKSMNPYLNKKENKQKIDIEKIIEEGRKIVIPKNVLDNLRAEYEKLYNLDLTKINMTYSIKETPLTNPCNQQNLNDSISFWDCSYIDHHNTKVKDSTINLCFKDDELDNTDLFDGSVSSELDDGKKEMKISEKVNNHILKLPGMKKAPVIIRESTNISINKLAKNVQSILKNESKTINNNTTSTNIHNNTTNLKSIFNGN